MRYNLERVTRIVAFLAVTLTGTLAFQNCAGYTAIDNPLYDQTSTATCIGVACTQDQSLLRLTVNNDSPVGLKSGTPTGTCGADDSSCVDLGGYCDDGGFPGNSLNWSLSGGSIATVSGVFTGACVEGRWSAQILLPTNYDYANMHVLTLTLNGVASDGSTVVSTVNANVRQIQLSPYN